MADPRLISIVVQDLNNDYQKKEAELEEVINNTNVKMEDRVKDIKKVLGELSTINGSMEVWEGMMKKMSTDNKENKEE